MDNSIREPLALLAYLYLQNAKFDKALNLLRLLKLEHPKDSFVSRSLAYALLMNQEYENALKEAEQCLRLPDLSKQNRIVTTLIKSKALMALGRQEAAQHAMQELMEQ